MRDKIKMDIHKIFQGKDNMNVFLNDLHSYAVALSRFNQRLEECVQKENSEETAEEFLQLTMSRLCGMAVFHTIYKDVFDRLEEEMKIEPEDIEQLIKALRDGPSNEQ